MKKMKILFLLVFLFPIQFLFPQKYVNIRNDLLVVKPQFAKKSSYPVFSPHIGIGLASGVRIGLMVQATEHIAGEISGGYDLANFVTLSDEEKRYGFGVSYRISQEIPVFISAIYALGIRNADANLRSPKYYYSLNVGYARIEKSSVMFFVRGGIILKYYYDRPMDKVEHDRNYFNLDIGIGYSF